MTILDCDLYFTPGRDPETGDAYLAPVLVSDDGETRLTANKVVTTVEKALSMYSGFTLAAAVEMHGGLEGLKEAVENQKEDDNEGPE